MHSICALASLIVQARDERLWWHFSPGLSHAAIVQRSMKSGTKVLHYFVSASTMKAKVYLRISLMLRLIALPGRFSVSLQTPIYTLELLLIISIIVKSFTNDWPAPVWPWGSYYPEDDISLVGEAKQLGQWKANHEAKLEAERLASDIVKFW